jgi:hypothetical protein
VTVPTVERAFLMVFFWRSASAGGISEIESTSGRSIRSRNIRA